MTTHIPELPHEYIEAQLNLLHDALAEASYPGYPGRSERLVTTVAELGRTATGALILPQGDWIIPGVNTVFQHHNVQPEPLQTYNLMRAGYQVDDHGRPLHPWFDRMVEDPKLGVLGGKGTYWRWGPNYTADSVVVHDGSILLIKRKDTGDWALPGGFINGGEHAALAAKRETYEETSVVLGDNWAIPIYKGLVVDPRMTAHAWPATTAYLFSLDSSEPRQKAVGKDDADAAAWCAIESLPNLKLFGSHLFLTRLALSQLKVASAQAKVLT